MTEPKKQIKYDLELNAGVAIPKFKLEQEDMEQLKLLMISPQWKLYRQVLSILKDGYTQTLLPMEEPNKITKTLGTIVGLNLALNQLGVLVADYELNHARRVSGGSTNQRKPAPKTGEEKTR